MPKYMVGSSQNTWNFMDAVRVAKSGDIIEIESEFWPEFESVTIDKNLTITGHINQKADGTLEYTNVLLGRFFICGGAKVSFQNVWIRNGKEKTNLINTKDGVTVQLENVVLESVQQMGEFYPAVFIKDHSQFVGNNVTVNENAASVLKFCAEDSTVTIENSTFNECKIVAQNSSVTVKGTGLCVTRSNVIDVTKAEVTLVSSTVEGADSGKDYPAIWLSGSKLTMEDTVVSQPQFAAAVFANDNSLCISKNDNITSIKLGDSRARLNGTTIREILQAGDGSSIFIDESADILGENEKKVDLFAFENSVIYGGKLCLHKENGPELRANTSSLISVSSIDYDNGDFSKISFDEDETGKISCKDQKKSGATGTPGQGADQKKDHENQMSAREQLDHLVGLKSVKKEIDKMLKMAEFNRQRVAQGLEPQEQSFHSVFMGNPGTGKTTVARLIGEVLFESGAFKSDEFKLIEASEPDFISQNVGGTAQQTMALLEKAKGGVLFIDEAYALNKKDANVNFGIEAINTILKYMEDHRGEIMIIFAGYTKEMEQFLKTNPGLTSRVPNKFVFEDYSPDEIVGMGEKELTDQQYHLENTEYYEQQVKRAYRNSLDHSNARWIRNFNEKLLKCVANRVMNEAIQDFQTIKNVDIDEVLSQGKYQESGAKNEDALEKLNKLIGIKGVKEQVGRFISLAELNQRREEQGQINEDFTLHSLFLGNPGTGKTTVARIIGEVLYQKGLIAQKKFIEVSSSDLVAGYVGQTAMKTREVLESALGGVLFIDEAYSLTMGKSSEFGPEAVNEILKFMEDHRKDMVIIFAGYTKEMGEFLETNSGLTSRIPHTFDFEDYTEDEIVQIGLLGLHRAGYKIDEENYADVVKRRYAKSEDHSNGRWVRNMNEQLILAMSSRISGVKDADINQILPEDLENMEIKNSVDMTESVQKEEFDPTPDENGYVAPPPAH